MAASAKFVAALRREIQAGYAAGAQRIAAQARELAPVLKRPSPRRVSGELRDAIQVQSPTTTDERVDVQVVIDPSAFYARFTELGYQPRSPRSNPRGRAVGKGLAVPGQFFMRRAFDANKRAIGDDVVKRVAAVIDKTNKGG